ncbi:hypothetical protein PIB30_050579, partial [Stylosanthes scabra]|nr:hypothetical protein [Stylosanthes scabra]
FFIASTFITLLASIFIAPNNAAGTSSRPAPSPPLAAPLAPFSQRPHSGPSSLLDCSAVAPTRDSLQPHWPTSCTVVVAPYRVVTSIATPLLPPGVGASPPRVAILSADLTSLLYALKHVHLVFDTTGNRSSLTHSLHTGFALRLDPIHSGHKFLSGIGGNSTS